jgi:hypothetical protein
MRDVGAEELTVANVSPHSKRRLAPRQIGIHLRTKQDLRKAISKRNPINKTLF